MAQAARTGQRQAFRDYQVLLDDPAARPSGGFDTYARALADIIVKAHRALP